MLFFVKKLRFTSMVWDWCMDLMADWAICLAVNVTNAQPAGEKHDVSRLWEETYLRKILSCLQLCLTSAESIRASKYPALLYLSVWWEHQSDVVLVTFLWDHSDKQLPVLHCCIQHNTTSNTPALCQRKWCNVTFNMHMCVIASLLQMMSSVYWLRFRTKSEVWVS